MACKKDYVEDAVHLELTMVNMESRQEVSILWKSINIFPSTSCSTITFHCCFNLQKRFSELMKQLRAIWNPSVWHEDDILNLEEYISFRTHESITKAIGILSNNAFGGFVGMGTAVQLKPGSLKRIFSWLKGEPFMNDVLSREHGFLSVGTGVGVDVVIASFLCENRLSVGFDHQAHLVIQGLQQIQQNFPWHLRKRLDLLHGDLRQLTTFDPYDIVYCNSRG